MRSRQLTILALVAAVAVGAAIWAARDRAPDSGNAAGEPLVAGLESAVNDVTRVDIGAGADKPLVTLERGENGWTVAQKSGYPADVGKLREMLLTLADATVLERKTSDPANYGQLGVGDETDEGAGGARLEISGLDEPVRLVIGNNARGGSSTYARREDDASVLLVSGNLDIEKNPVEWLRRDILDVAADRVQSVSIEQPDGHSLAISKANREVPDFSVENIPAGQQVKSAADVSSVASALTGLRLEDVRPAPEAPAQDAVQSVYRLFDGTVLTVRAHEEDGKKLIHVDAAFDEELAGRMAPAVAASGPDEPAAPVSAGTEEPAPGASGPGEPGASRDEANPASAKDAAETAAEAQRAERAANRENATSLDARLGPWEFDVSDYKYEQLTRGPGDLFEPTVAAKPADAD